MVRLQDALRKAVRMSGAELLGEKRLLFILSDFRAFDEYPAVKQVITAIVSRGSGKELAGLFLEEDRASCLLYAQNLRKSLSGQGRFREDLSDYAVGSVLYALGLQDSVREPSYHGFDPVEHGSGAGQRETREWKERAAEENRGRKQEERSSRGGAASRAGAEERPVRKAARLQDTRGGNASSGDTDRRAAVQQSRGRVSGGSSGAAPRNAVAERSSGWLKWIIAAVLLAVVIAAADHSCSRAPYGHSGMTLNSRGTVEAHASARVTARAGAAVNHAGQYEYQQGEQYYYGRRDYAKALAWYRQAVDKGSSDAEYRIGWMYEYGLGVRPDAQEALGWYMRAAAHGNKDAQAGIERLEPERGAHPAGAGHEQGLRDLEQGEKSYYAKDYPEAVKWFRKSAGQGNALAQNWLGEMYSYGLGVSRNDAEAAEWYRKSAEQGNADAESIMGTLYEDGKGVRRDYEEALKWFRRAAVHGSRNAQGGIERVEKRISAQK